MPSIGASLQSIRKSQHANPRKGLGIRIRFR